MTENKYESLQPKEKKQFRFILNSELINSALHNPKMEVDEFYNIVWGKFKEKNQPKQSSKKQKSTKNQKNIKIDNYIDELDPFQIYVKTQSKLRKDEFKNVSTVIRNKLFAHEWNKLTEEEKQKVVNENGRFTNIKHH